MIYYGEYLAGVHIRVLRSPDREKNALDKENVCK
jgi:hypothetical protein